MSSAKRPPSLLFRLSLTALAIVLLALSLIGLAVDRAFVTAEREAQRERLEAVAVAVLSGLDVAADGSLSWMGVTAEALPLQPTVGLYAGAFTARDQWLSSSTLGIEVPVARGEVARGQTRFVIAEDPDAWTVYRLGLGWELDDGEIIDLEVWAAEDAQRVAGALASFRSDFWRWLAIAAGVLLAAQTVLLAQPLLVLRRVAGEVGQLERGECEQLTGRYPRELRPLTDNLNALMRTERANAERYGQALGDLAHSLKTPLAVLQAQADSGRPVDTDELRDSVAQMQLRIRSELDRAARSARRTMLPLIEVAPQAQRLVRTLDRLYPAVDFALDCPQRLHAHIAERDLSELLGNLLDNAAKYGGGRVRLSLAPSADQTRRRGLRLVVEDNGSGIDPERFETLLQRGVRGDERAEGHGLGLAIVQRIVDSYEGEITAGRSALGGLSVAIELRPG
ncbi:MAG: ATP-binding protein [Wenzhouxiangellaceae bacterium]|nr:ATP-binding protein [Wenzhouxiangellaceae bacterium]